VIKINKIQIKYIPIFSKVKGKVHTVIQETT